MESTYPAPWFVTLHFLLHSLQSVDARFVKLTKALVKMTFYLTFYLTVPILLSIIRQKVRVRVWIGSAQAPDDRSIKFCL